MVAGVAALYLIYHFFTFIPIYIYCFSNNFVPLGKVFLVNSRNDLNIIRNGENLMEPPSWGFICWGQMLWAGDLWRWGFFALEGGGYKSIPWGALFRIRACTKQRESYPRSLRNSPGSCALVSCLGSHAKPSGRQRAGNCHFPVLPPCPTQLDDARAALKGLWSSLTSSVWPLCWGRKGCWTGSTGRKTSHSSRKECANSMCSFLSFFFFQEGQLPIFLKAELSAGLTFLPSFKHYSYYLIFQNNTVAEIPTLRMQCFSVFIQPAVWISFPCFYTTKMLR